MISIGLMRQIRAGYLLPWEGIHGIVHWARVLENGMRLAESTGARIEVVQLFAVLHDARRLKNGRDPKHGLRGAELALALRGTGVRLTDEDFALLQEACTHHTDALTHSDLTVQVCFDADRLDFARVGILPNPKYLSTPAARDPEMMQWATDRSRQGFVPDIVADWRAA